LGDIGCFDCRISELPRLQDVIDYFRWRNEDAYRNALNAHCYWQLRKTGKTVQEATKALHKLGVAAKNELLFQHNINFNELPAWQKRGIGFYWENYQKESLNPNTQTTVMATRRRLKMNAELPMKDKYSDFIEKIIAENI
jgi:tRNA(His) guanylyltransferase